MRFCTYVLCVLALCVACDTSDAQILRRRSSGGCTSGSCFGGSCPVPTSAVPAPIESRPLENGVTGQGGAKPEPKALPSPEPIPSPMRPDPPLIGQLPADPDDGVFFGVDWDKIADRKYDDKAHKISLAEALDFAKGDYADFKTNLRLVIIGTPAERAPFEAAYDALPIAERDKLSLWTCAADHWSLRDSDGGELRFVADGKPTVYLLAPDGEPIHRQDGGTPQEAIEAIRAGKKKYDPKRDPDLRKNPDPARVPTLAIGRIAKKFMPVALVGAGAFVAVSLFSRRKS